MQKRYRLAVVNTHPIQYFAPLYRRIAESSEIDITVYYCSRQSVTAHAVDEGFGRPVVWDVPLLHGYRHGFLANLWGEIGAERGFFGLINPGIVLELFRGRYDALWVHGHYPFTHLLAILAAKLAGVRVFMRSETHLVLQRSGLKRVLRGPLMKLLYRMCDACLYIGSRNRDFYRHHGVPEEKLFFVPYTVDNEFFASLVAASAPERSRLKAELGIAAGVPVILFASKLIPRKRAGDLLAAYARLRAQGIDAALVIIGSGSEYAQLKEDARSSGIPAVHFLGFVNQSELPRYFSMADVFVLPSADEPWGLIINEAMCSGLPIVTTREVGASADLVRPGETGFVYEAGDIDTLEQCLTRLVRSPELRVRLGANGRTFMNGWSYAECITGIREALGRG